MVDVGAGARNTLTADADLEALCDANGCVPAHIMTREAAMCVAGVFNLPQPTVEGLVWRANLLPSILVGNDELSWVVETPVEVTPEREQIEYVEFDAVDADPSSPIMFLVTYYD